MVLKNDVDKSWWGWLVDDAGGREVEIRDKILAAIDARNIPKSRARAGGGLNMWWRKDGNFIDATCTMDGDIHTTIHVMEYGTSLWIGRAAESQRASNYYKRMASSAFIDTIDRCISSTIRSLFEESAVHELKDQQPELAK